MITFSSQWRSKAGIVNKRAICPAEHPTCATPRSTCPLPSRWEQATLRKCHLPSSLPPSLPPAQIVVTYFLTNGEKEVLKAILLSFLLFLLLLRYTCSSALRSPSLASDIISYLWRRISHSYSLSRLHLLLFTSPLTLLFAVVRTFLHIN